MDCQKGHAPPRATGGRQRCGPRRQAIDVSHGGAIDVGEGPGARGCGRLAIEGSRRAGRLRDSGGQTILLSRRQAGMHRWLAILAPGLLIAATGVGAGDLVPAGLAGNRLGLSIVWAVALGALLKWALNEGLARWQLATGTTLLEAWID